MNTYDSSKFPTGLYDSMRHASVRRRTVVGLIAAMMSMPSLARAQDCNNNGIPDSSEIPAKSNLFEDAVNYFYDASFDSYSDVKLADMDNDGDLDAVSCGYNRMRVQWNVGDGTFFDPGRFEYGGSVASVDVGDLDGDGFQDVVAANSFTDSLEVFLNEKTGLLMPRVAYPAGVDPRRVKLGDLDQDGDLDVVLADGSTVSSLIYVYFNNGDATFASPITYGGNERCYALAVSDLDGDGKLDIAATIANNELLLLQNDGAGGFIELARMTIGNGPSDIAAGDFTDDGYNDLVITNQDDDNMSLWVNDGTGAFGGNYLYYAGIGPECVQVADLDGDGNLDVAISAEQAPSGPTNMSFYYNNGAGSFARYVYPARALRMSAGDVDADGNIDLVTVLYNGMKVIRHKDSDCNGNAVLDECEIDSATSTDCNGNGIPDTCEIATNAAADCNANGVPDECDIAAGISSDCDADGILDECAEPAELRLFDTLVAYDVDAEPYYGAIGDLNNDGHEDIVTLNIQVDQFSVMMNNGDGTFADEVTYPTGDYPSAVAIADFNGDGRVDLTIVNRYDENFTIFLQNSSGAFVQGTTINVGQGNSPLAIVACDADNDGDIDLVRTSDFGTVFVYRNSGDGTFTSGPSISVAGSGSLVAGDLNGDSYPDFVASSNNGNVAVVMNNGSQSFVSRTYYDAGGAISYPGLALGDLDGDGDLDIAAAHYSLNVVSLLFNNGSGVFSGLTNIPVDHGPATVFVGDINGDGINDIVCSNAKDYGISMFLGLGGGTFGEKRQFYTGSKPWWVGGGDLDGDGDTDLAAANSIGRSVSLLFKVNDCNANGIHDTCEIESGASSDCNGDGVLDQCEPDSDHDSIPDSCDVCEGFNDLADFDGDGIPNGCEEPCIDTLLGDVDESGDVDVSDIGAFSAVVVNPASATGSAYCAADVNQDLRVNGLDVREFVALLVAP